MILPDVRNAHVNGKRVFLRLDLDVPLSEVSSQQSDVRTIVDDFRLKAGLPTVEYLLEHGATVIIAGHLGRPSGVEEKYSLRPVAEWFGYNFKFQISNFKFSNGLEGWRLSDHLFVLENLRFNNGEKDPSTSSGQEFVKKLASLADIYVDDAFAVSHRNDASITGVPKILPHFAGLRLLKEVETLSSVLVDPKRPLVMVIGGAKLETKLPLIEKMHHFSDFVLAGGKLAGDTKELLRVAHEKIIERKSVLLIAQLNEEKTDITKVSTENFCQVIVEAKTVVWNGPMGKIEEEKFSEHTKEIAEAIINSKAFSIVGGGDTVGFLTRNGLVDKFSFVSTGGGAMLAFLAGEILPGLSALTVSK